VPEQREAVNRAATHIDLAQGTVPARGSVEEEVRERAHLASFSRRERRAFTARATSLIEDLTANLPVGPDGHGALEQPVADAALGIAGGVTVIVLSGLPPQEDPARRTPADAFAAELARRGVTVILLQVESRPRQPVSPAGTELRADDAGKSRVEVEP
jgi:hypothetical protein